MACEMCAGMEPHRAAAEVVDDGAGRRPHPEDAMAELDEDGILRIETPLGDGRGNRYHILLPVAFCPWCGEPLPMGE